MDVNFKEVNAQIFITQMDGTIRVSSKAPSLRNINWRFSCFLKIYTLCLNFISNIIKLFYLKMFEDNLTIRYSVNND
jgi:hypothetical protein